MRHLRAYSLMQNTMFAAAALFALGRLAQAAPVVVDNFDAPSPEVAYVISYLNSDPTTISTLDGSIIGGRRDLNVDVIGTARLTSAAGMIGEGTYYSNTGTPGAIITLSYEGAAGLGLGAADLVDSGNTKLELDFVSLEAGIGTTADIVVELTSGIGAATFSGMIPESGSPFTYDIPFAAFTVGGGFTGFDAVDSIVIKLNPLGASSIDLELNGIRSVPEPSTLALLGLGLAGLVLRRRLAA